jgi:protein SCO1/2
MSEAQATPSLATVESPHPAGSAAWFGERIGRFVGRLVGSWKFWLMAMLLIFVLPLVRALLRQVPPMPKDLGAIPAFALTDQNGEAFGSKNLAGKVVIVDFIFTRCGSICPTLSAEMEKIQYRLRNAGDAVHMVTITVDPDYDTPPRLEAYARTYHADERLWTFVTGPYDDVRKAVVQGFKETMEKDPVPGGDPQSDYMILHGGHLILVDQTGHIRGYYDTDDTDVDQMMSDVELLANGPLGQKAVTDW